MRKLKIKHIFKYLRKKFYRLFNFIGLPSLILIHPIFQGSPESPLIFSLVLKVFGGQPVNQLEDEALKNGVSKEHFQVLYY